MQRGLSHGLYLLDVRVVVDVVVVVVVLLLTFSTVIFFSNTRCTLITNMCTKQQ